MRVVACRLLNFGVCAIKPSRFFKPTIFKKFFAVLLLCMVVCSATILLSVHWSFSQGFGAYLLQAEATQLDKLVKLLEEAYVKEGNWQFLEHNRHRWLDFLRRALEPQHLAAHTEPDGFHPPEQGPPPHEHAHFPPPPRSEDGRDFGPPAGPPHRPHHYAPPKMLSKLLGERIQLLDAAKNKIIGLGEISLTRSLLRPIKQGSTIVGWLALRPSDLINDHLALLFVQQQIRNNYLIAALALLLAILGALTVTSRLLTPIQRIAKGAQALVKGAYNTQIAVPSNDELGQLAQDFNLLAQTLQANEQARRYWIADISHELRTPLAILRGEIEALQDGVRELSPDSMHSLHSEVLNLTRLVDDLYELSLSDLGSQHYELSLLDLPACLQAVLQLFYAPFQANGLELRYRGTEQSLTVMGDARRLRQLFVNLLENSRRYSQAGGFCEVSVSSSGQTVMVLLQDTAPAVPDWALAKLFDRLYRVDKSRSRDLGGAGLGLAISQAVVHAHHGTIDAFHSPYGGLSIKISLPLVTQPN